ncbi:MAG: gluconate 2-dehydrogenase subunit 3 family protein [Longimicrobiales bacterium]
MHRREALGRLAATAAAVPVLAALRPDELFGLGGRVHERIAQGQAYAPIALGPHQFQTVTEVSELILPETDTPGATSAGVNRFIDLIVDEWFDDAERASFLAGLADLDARSRTAFGGDFIEGSGEQQTALLAQLDAEMAALRASEPERAETLFFHRVKWLTLFGYYTSEPGATQELNWVAMPGAYRGCEPIVARP